MPQDATVYDFDRVIDRTKSDSLKWRAYGEALPLWVADMDFAAPEPVRRALAARVDHGVFGYACEPPELRPVLVDWLARRFGWRVDPVALVFVPGVVTGFNIACRAFARPGEGVLVQTPVYPPMLEAPGNFGLRRDETPLTRQADGRYRVDWEALEAAVGPDTRLFLLCNPQNPTGRVFTADELAQIAEVCLQHDLILCSDEIHADLVYPGARHLPIAALGPEIAARTITLMAPSKTFNIPGLGFSLAVIENAALRAAFVSAAHGIVPHANALGAVAALAAYGEGEPWLEACLRYLEANRAALTAAVRDRLPGVRMASPEGTYLAWLDCRAAGLGKAPARFFLQRAGVALNEGTSFGHGGEGFVRLNFACPRSILKSALDRMAAAVDSVAR
ncbi:MAG: PatB family C-S lyase [Deltaproteobacteria bacterium]|nr:PatB family C-S lyase [Deltaproteobacteria bacterium]